MDIKDVEVKIPAGTIIKVAGHAVRLLDSLYLDKDRGLIELEDHYIIDDIFTCKPKDIEKQKESQAQDFPTTGVKK